MSVLSGGERARLTLCKLILSRMNLLILDEPTNHLDIDSREALEGALSAFDGTVIAVSHDRYFIEKLATRILEIAPGHGISGTVSGSGSDFTDYRVTHPGTAYTEYRQFMEARQSGSVAPSRMGIPSAGCRLRRAVLVQGSLSPGAAVCRRATQAPSPSGASTCRIRYA